MKALLALAFALLSPVMLFCQDAARPAESNLLYHAEHNIGVLIHTRGFGLNAQFAHFNRAGHYRLLDFSFYLLRSPKEIRLPNPSIPESRPYVFGKLNNLLILKGNYGGKRTLAERVSRKSIRIDLNYSLGPLAGFLKPQYFQVQVPDPDGGAPTLIETPFEKDNQVYQRNTIGNASFFKGIGKTTYMMGVNAKLSLNFEWGSVDYKYWSLETGAMLDAFPQEVPIFAYGKNDQVFANIFLALSYGSRK